MPLGIDSHGGIANDQVNTGEEKIEYFDDVYPQCHFVVSDVSVRTKRQDGMSIPEYTCEGKVVDSDGHEIQPEGEFYPIQIEEGTTLSVRFESGYLNGREFEIANKTQKKTDPSTGQPETNYTLRFTIVADGSIEDGTLIPSGNFKPNIGDKFALFNMKMPEAYITYAQEELAQKAYERLIEYQDTVPDVKCTSSPDDFSRFDMRFGTRFTINSEKIGFTTRDVVINGVTKTVRVPIDFISRVTAYSYKLTKVNEVQFTLSSALVRGTLADMAAAITNVSYATDGLGQRSINLSRRGWRDASEVADMISSVTTEMMLVGNAKYQFGYTSEVKPVHSNGAFVGLEVSYGQLQHTQEPYIGYANGGMWQIQPAIGDGKINVDVNGNPLDGTKPYYVFAICSTDNLEWAQIVLMDKEYADTNNIYRKDTDVDSENDSYPAYLLLGILSSEYAETKDGVSTNERVFSPTNGFTAIEGGTITTEQIQDANRRLIIDFSSNPPRIIAKRGAQIIGNITFISSDGAETSLANKMNSVDEELAKEIGGENLYAGVDPLNIITTRKDTDIILENGKKYVISIAAIDGDAYGLLAKEKIGSAYSDLGWIVENGTIGTMQHYEKKSLVVTGHGGKLALQVTSSGANYYYTLSGIMVQQGEKPTTYQPTYKYLAEAFEHDATQLTTSTNGGLIISALLKLMNQDGDVTAGMSGLSGDNVYGWCGGTYADAIEAAAGGAPLPILLTKLGIGSRIGCLKVISETEVDVESSLGLIRIDTASGGIRILKENQEKIVIIPSNVDSYKSPAAIEISDYDYSDKEDEYVGSSISWASDYVSVPTADNHIEFECKFYAGSTFTRQNGMNNGEDTARAAIVVKIQKEVNGSWQDYETLKDETQSGTIPQMSQGQYQTITIWLSYQQTAKFDNLPAGDYRLSVSMGRNGTADCETFVNNCSVGTSGYYYPAVVPKTVIGLNGIVCANTRTRFFQVVNEDNSQKVIMAGLQTSSTGLTSGQIYRDGNYLKIV